MASLPQAGIELIAQNFAQYMSQVQSASDATTKFGQATANAAGQASGGMDKAAGGVSGASQIMIGALRQVGVLAVDALAKAGTAVAGFAKDSIDVAGNFQQGMAEFQNAVGRTLDGSGKSLEDFKSLFISLGKELPVSTREVEQAATEMAKGGIDPAVIAAGALKNTIQFAAASLKGDLVSAAQISAKTMQAWTAVTDSAATKTAFLTHAQNLMTQATTAASTTVDQLFLGLSNVGGSARLAGVSFDETVTALAQLTPSFASSSDAGTAFKTLLGRLQPTTKPAIAAMMDLGLYTKESGSAFYDANGQFVGMAKAEQLLYNATKDLSPAQRELALQTIFGTDAIRAAAVFASQGADGYNALAASIGKQTTLQEAAANVQATYNTALENAKGSVEALQITVGSALLPVLTNLLNNVIAPGVNTVTTMADALTGNAQAFVNLSPAAQGVVTALQGFGAALQPLTLLASVVFGQIASGKINVFELGVALDNVAPGASRLIGALQQVGGVLSGTVVPAVGQAVSWVGTNLPAATQTASTIWQTVLAPEFAAAGALITGQLIPAGQQLISWLSSLGISTTTTSGIWQTVLLPALQAGSAFVSGTVIPAIGVLVQWLRDTLPVAVAATSSFFTGTLLPAATAVSGFFTNTLVPAAKSVWSFFQTYLSPILSALADLFLALGEVAVKSAIAQFMSMYSAAANNLTPALTLLKGAVSVLTDMIKFSLAPFAAMIDYANKAAGVFGGWKSIVDGVTSAVHKLADAIRGLPSLPGAGGAAPPGRASGGPVAAGVMYTVGEHGPETLIGPRGGGFILPNPPARYAASPQSIASQAAVTNNYYGQVGNSYAPMYAPTYAPGTAAPPAGAILQAMTSW